jgi:translation elongation factor EF-Tu-like GTPase
MGWKFWKRSDARPRDTFPPPIQDTAPPGGFGLTVEDVFSITGRGTIVTGRVLAGTVSVGDQVRITRAGQVVATTQVTGIEMFRKIVDTAKAGENVGLLLRGVERNQVIRGDVVSK